MRTIIVFTIITMLDTISAKLIGDHICHKEKTYTVNVTEYVTRNLTVRHYKWCLNVPPRCSFYTIKMVNDSQIIEKEMVDTVEECCPGFKESNDYCIPQCGVCNQGFCDTLKDQCICKAGYKGKICNLECDAFHWGPNCIYNCTCNERATCNPKNGNCVCPSGWHGVACDIPCEEGFYGRNCSEKCSCRENELCHHISGECETKLTTTTTATESTISTLLTTVEAFSIRSQEIEEERNASTTTIMTEITTKSFENLTSMTISNNGKFKTYATENGLYTINHDLLPNNNNSGIIELDDKTNNNNNNNNENKEVEVLEIPSTKTNISISSTDIMKHSLKAKVNHIQLSVTTESSPNYLNGGKEDSSYMSDEIIKGNEKNDNGLIYTMSAIFAVSLTIIIFAVVIIFVQHNKKTRRKLKTKSQVSNNKGLPSVSVYTTSIFHTPLPEPPIIENPIFIQSPENSSEVLETRIVCNLNFQNQNVKDANKEYLYDHPPSTGSYRAASIPEPPETFSLTSSNISEPLYDEIPSGILPVSAIAHPPQSYKTLSLYMNTCGKTHF